MRRNIRTPELVDLAKEFLRVGNSYLEAGKKLGVTGTTIKAWTDPEFAAHRRNQINQRRNGNSGERRARSVPIVSAAYASYRPPSDEEVAQRFSEIPPDTRTEGERLLGSPIPGRSALDRSK